MNDHLHNQRFDENTASLLQQTVLDIRAEEKSISEARDNIKALMAQAKAHGLDPAMIRTVLKQHDTDVEDLRETSMLVDLYRTGLGLEPIQQPLDRAPTPKAKGK